MKTSKHSQPFSDKLKNVILTVLSILFCVVFFLQTEASTLFITIYCVIAVGSTFFLVVWTNDEKHVSKLLFGSLFFSSTYLLLLSFSQNVWYIVAINLVYCIYMFFAWHIIIAHIYKQEYKGNATNDDENILGFCFFIIGALVLALIIQYADSLFDKKKTEILNEKESLNSMPYLEILKIDDVVKISSYKLFYYGTGRYDYVSVYKADSKKVIASKVGDSIRFSGVDTTSIIQTANFYEIKFKE